MSKVDAWIERMAVFTASWLAVWLFPDRAARALGWATLISFIMLVYQVRKETR